MDEQQRPAEQDTDIRPVGQTRIGDIERERAAKLIVNAVGSGHLNVEEADRRIAAVYQARWPADLETLTADLPTPGRPTPPPPPPHQPAPRRSGALPLLPLLLLAFGFLIIAGHLVGPWMFPLVPILLGVALLMRWRTHQST